MKLQVAESCEEKEEGKENLNVVGGFFWTDHEVYSQQNVCLSVQKKKIFFQHLFVQFHLQLPVSGWNYESRQMYFKASVTAHSQPEEKKQLSEMYTDFNES